MSWITFALVTSLSLYPRALCRQNTSGTQDRSNDLNPESDISPSFFASPSDYPSSLFDNFPDLNHFPEFGEIFRLSRTTTPPPPFRFPGYVRQPFPDDDYKTDDPPLRRRRPPRPASSSSSRMKVSKGERGVTIDKQRPSHSSTSTAPSSSSKTFPKVFRFTQDRVNLADFDSRKKVNENYLSLSKGDGLDASVVRREGFYILHGGVFEIDGGVPR